MHLEICSTSLHPSLPDHFTPSFTVIFKLVSVLLLNVLTYCLYRCLCSSFSGPSLLFIYRGPSGRSGTACHYFCCDLEERFSSSDTRKATYIRVAIIPNPTLHRVLEQDLAGQPCTQKFKIPTILDSKSLSLFSFPFYASCLPLLYLHSPRLPSRLQGKLLRLRGLGLGLVWITSVWIFSINGPGMCHTHVLAPPPHIHV